MSDVDVAAEQSEDDFQEGLQEALSGVEESEDSAAEEPESSFFDTQVAAPEESGSVEAPPTEVGIDDWVTRFEGVDLSSAPKGAGVPANRFSQVIRQRNEVRYELQELRAEVDSLRHQAQKPAWMDELASTLKPAPQTDDDAWLKSILGEQEQAQEPALTPQHLNQMLEQHPQFQRFNQFINQQEQARVQYGEAQRLKASVDEILEIHPDIPPKALYRAYAAGEDLMDVAREMMEWRGVGQQAAAPRATPAAAAPPVPSRGPSKPAPAQVENGSSLDDDQFLMHMKNVVKSTFGR